MLDSWGPESVPYLGRRLTAVTTALITGPLVGTFIKQPAIEGGAPALDVQKLVDQAEKITREIDRRTFEIAHFVGKKQHV